MTQAEAILRNLNSELNRLSNSTIETVRGNIAAREAHNDEIRREFEETLRQFNRMANNYRKAHPQRAEEFLNWLNQQN